MCGGQDPKALSEQELKGSLAREERERLSSHPTQKPTSVGMAKGETGLGRRELVEIMQPNHIRHLKLGLSQEMKSKS